MHAAALLLLPTLAAAAAAPEDGDAPPPLHDPTRHELDWVALPILSYNADEGAGAGVVVGLYHFYGGVSPVRDDISVRLFATTNLVQRHELRWDAREMFGLPVRGWFRLGLFSTVTAAYCGVGENPTCLGELTAPSSGQASHRYLMRYIRPSADTLLRWRVIDHFELVGGWTVAYYKSGDFLHAGPYPGSLYAKQFPEGEDGFSSVPQAGFVFDTRDFEPWPTRGVMLEVTGRGAHPWLGSAWTYGGGDVSLATYWPLPDVRAFVVGAADDDDGGDGAPLVLANRALVDVLDGDVPTAELGEIGGTRSGLTAFGGQWIGRGVRERRFIGKVKIVDQLELRRRFLDLRFGKFKVDVGASLFADAGMVGASLEDWGGRPQLLWGAGAGLRFMFQDAIVMRTDIAASPDEEKQPSFYTPVGFPF